MVLYRLWSKVWPVLFYAASIACLAVLVVPLALRPEPVPEAGAPVAAEAELPELGFVEPAVLFSGERDVIRLAYDDSGAHDAVVSFFEGITGSAELSDVILTAATIFDIPVSLAFALCWEESGFDPGAVNRANRNRSVDRGLFQLNNAAFPTLTEDEFFNPAINAYYGMAHLRHCLDTAGTEVAGLAMYNAGPARVRADGTPKTTLDYVSRIMERRNRIDALFLSECLEPVMAFLAGGDSTAATLSLLTPPGKS